MRLPQHRTSSIAAYELYMRGSDPLLFRSDDGVRQAVDYMRRAIDLDSSYAAPYAGMASALLRTLETAESREAREQVVLSADEAAARALSLDDSLAQAHMSMGFLRTFVMDLDSAEVHLTRAVRLDPTNARAHEWLATHYIRAGRPEEGLAAAEQALAIEPFYPNAEAEAARALASMGRCPEALVRLEPLFLLDPPLLRVAPTAAQCYALMGRWDTAIAEMQRGRNDRGPRGEALVAYLLARSGQTERADSMRRALTEQWETEDPFALTIVALGFHDLAAAFLWLDRAIAARTLYVGSGISLTDPIFEELRRDPRFEVRRQQLGIAEPRARFR